MDQFSYTMTQKVYENLNVIEGLRTKILTIPLSQSTEIAQRWRMLEQKIFFSLRLADTPLSEQKVRRLISHSGTLGEKRTLTLPEEDVIDYRIALDYIKQYWYVSEKRISLKTISTLNGVGTGGRLLPLHQESVRTILTYLQSQEEHPLIKSAIGLIRLNTLRPFTLGNERTARLFMHLLLAKYGYDVRGMLAPETYWHANRTTFEALSRRTEPNITPWLEFFVLSVRDQLTAAHASLLDTKTTTLAPTLPKGFFDLNDRQRYILTYLDEPLARVTNKNVQDLCKVSQITASRDLARLVTLGLLFARGKGRSTYYTKV